jgi:hypothetical protein
MNSDFKDLLQAFADHRVKYLIVGGQAVIFHGQPRFTKDLDVWVEPTPENARQLAAALRQFGIPLIERFPTPLRPRSTRRPIDRE